MLGRMRLDCLYLIPFNVSSVVRLECEQPDGSTAALQVQMTPAQATEVARALQRLAETVVQPGTSLKQ